MKSKKRFSEGLCKLHSRLRLFLFKLCWGFLYDLTFVVWFRKWRWIFRGWRIEPCDRCDGRGWHKYFKECPECRRKINWNNETCSCGHEFLK